MDVSMYGENGQSFSHLLTFLPLQSHIALIAATAHFLVPLVFVAVELSIFIVHSLVDVGEAIFT